MLTTTKVCSVQEALLAFDTFIKPILKNFTTLPSFVEYLGLLVKKQFVERLFRSIRMVRRGDRLRISWQMPEMTEHYQLVLKLDKHVAE